MNCPGVFGDERYFNLMTTCVSLPASTLTTRHAVQSIMNAIDNAGRQIA